MSPCLSRDNSRILPGCLGKLEPDRQAAALSLVPIKQPWGRAKTSLDPLAPRASATATLAQPDLETCVTSKLSCPWLILWLKQASLRLGLAALELKTTLPLQDLPVQELRPLLKYRLTLSHPRLLSLTRPRLLGDLGNDFIKKIQYFNYTLAEGLG